MQEQPVTPVVEEVVHILVSDIDNTARQTNRVSDWVTGFEGVEQFPQFPQLTKEQENNALNALTYSAEIGLLLASGAFDSVAFCSHHSVRSYLDKFTDFGLMNPHLYANIDKVDCLTLAHFEEWAAELMQKNRTTFLGTFLQYKGDPHGIAAAIRQYEKGLQDYLKTNKDSLKDQDFHNGLGKIIPPLLQAFTRFEQEEKECQIEQIIETAYQRYKGSHKKIIITYIDDKRMVTEEFLKAVKLNKIKIPANIEIRFHHASCFPANNAFLHLATVQGTDGAPLITDNFMEIYTQDGLSYPNSYPDKRVSVETFLQAIQQSKSKLKPSNPQRYDSSAAPTRSQHPPVGLRRPAPAYTPAAALTPSPAYTPSSMGPSENELRESLRNMDYSEDAINYALQQITKQGPLTGSLDAQLNLAMDAAMSHVPTASAPPLTYTSTAANAGTHPNPATFLMPTHPGTDPGTAQANTLSTSPPQRYDFSASPARNPTAPVAHRAPAPAYTPAAALAPFGNDPSPPYTPTPTSAMAPSEDQVRATLVNTALAMGFSQKNIDKGLQRIAGKGKQLSADLTAQLEQLTHEMSAFTTESDDAIDMNKLKSIVLHGPDGPNGAPWPEGTLSQYVPKLFRQPQPPSGIVAMREALEKVGEITNENAKASWESLRKIAGDHAKNSFVQINPIISDFYITLITSETPSLAVALMQAEKQTVFRGTPL